MKKSYLLFIITVLLLQQLSVGGDLRADEPTDVTKAAHKATEFYRNRVSTEGGYLWRYSSDLSMRQGENKADDQTVWVQPPGTPSIGQVFLKAWRVTGDPYYLEAATEVGICLVRGQLQSGGWAYQIYFEPEMRKKQAYRADSGKANGKGKNISTLDDDTTQSATAFLAELDAALDFKNEKIHEAAQYALKRLLAVQYPNGGYGQRFDGGKRINADPQRFPVKRAEFPPEGTEPTHEKDYSQFYTLNDNLVRDLLRTFFVAAEVYGIEKDGVLIPNEKYVAAARRLGDFLILAQLPEPQPAWAQQYDFQMRPCWARKFEPAAVTGGESQSAIDTLLELYLFTGDKKYLEPIPRAVAYLERSKLPDGKLARFYEMRTNRPLYMTKNYELTYNGDDVPTHYAFTIGLRSWPVEEYLGMDEPTRLRRFESLRNSYRNRGIRKANAKETAKILKDMDERGAWVTRGTLLAAPDRSDLPIIDNGVFIKNMNVLLNAFAAEKDAKK